LHPVENYNDPLQFYCYVDAPYILHPDSTSHTGYLITFEKSGSFFSKSIKQKLVAISSTHAETIALFSLVKEIRYLLDLSDEVRIRIGTPIMVFEDNKPLVQLTELHANGMKKCEHFLMMVAYIKEQVSKRLITTIEKIPTKLNNPADILSKPTYGSDFVDKRNKALGSCDTMDIDDSMQIVGENENENEEKRSEK
jgi:hypothetical protein